MSTPLTSILKQGTVAIMLVGAGIAGIWFELFNFPVSLGLAVIGLYLLKRSFARIYGIVSERRHTSRLSLPEGWEKKTNVILPYGGDADLVIKTDRKLRFVIEIKSYRCVKKTLFGGLVKCNGEKPQGDPIKQAKRAADALEGIPVLWLPAGKKKTFLLDGVLIVHGPHDELIKQVSAY